MITKLLWLLSIFTIPLLMINYLRIADIPFTQIFLLLAIFLNVKEFVGHKTYPIEKAIYALFFFFLLLSIFDLARSQDSDITGFESIKILILIVMLRGYSVFISKYGMEFFVKWILISSTVVTSILVFRSLILLKATWFVVNPDSIITRVGKNQLAFYFALVTPFAIWYLSSKKLNFRLKVLVIASLAIHLFAAIYTQSRGVLLSLIAGYILTLIFYRKKFFNVKTITFFVCVACLPVFFISQFNVFDLNEVSTKSSNLVSSDDAGADDVRKGMIDDAFNMFEFNPLIGIGTDNFVFNTGHATHNTYLQILAENGLVGFGTFMVVIFLINKRLRSYSTNSFYYYLTANLLWGLWVYLIVINGLFDAITLIPLSFVVCYERNFIEQRKALRLATNTAYVNV